MLLCKVTQSEYNFAKHFSQMSFSMPGDHERSQSAKSFQFSGEKSSQKVHDLASIIEDLQRRRKLYQFIHSNREK